MKKLLTITILFFLFKANSQCFNKVDSSNYFTLGLKSDGSLWAWGDNLSGLFGNGTTIGSALPIQIGSETNWASIATGFEHTIALKNDGTLWAWGLNFSGQLGDGTTVAKNVPIQIGTENDWQTISTVGHTSFAIKNNGTLWAWGGNNISALGLGFFSASVNLPTQVGTDTNWKIIIAGYDHTLAIKNNNTLWGWGSNGYGQMGNGVFLGVNLVPTQIGTESNWKTASLGNEHSVAIKLDGTLWAWGGNSYGELGDGSTINRNIPVQIGNEINWKLISSDYLNTYAIKNDNTLWAWGDNTYYSYGNNTTVSSTFPIQIGSETNWKDISPGSYQKMAMKNDNSISIWGVKPFGVSIMPNNTSVTPFIDACTLLSSDGFDDNSIQVYPNPANDIVYIRNNNNESEVNIKIFDNIGKLVLSQSEGQEINIANLKTGIYIMYIEIENSIQKCKLIKI